MYDKISRAFDNSEKIFWYCISFDPSKQTRSLQDSRDTTRFVHNLRNYASIYLICCWMLLTDDTGFFDCCQGKQAKQNLQNDESTLPVSWFVEWQESKSLCKDHRMLFCTRPQQFLHYWMSSLKQQSLKNHPESNLTIWLWCYLVYKFGLRKDLGSTDAIGTLRVLTINRKELPNCLGCVCIYI